MFLMFLLLTLLLGLIMYLTWDMLAYDEYLLLAIEYVEEIAEKLPKETKELINQKKN